MRRLAALAGAFALAGCITLPTAKLDVTRPIAVEPGTFADAYLQDGQRLADVEERLKEHPATAERMEGIGTKRGVALGLGLVGSLLVLVDSYRNFKSTLDQADNPLTPAKTDYKLALAGAALIVVGIPFNVSANRQLSEAVGLYNAAVMANPPARVPPAAAPAPGAPPPLQAPPGVPPGTTFPRRLSGADITVHFRAHPEIRANPTTKPVTIWFRAGGALRRECAACQLTTAEGMLIVKETEALACFSWVRATYPDAGCFRLIQTAPTAFQLRDENDQLVLEYAVGP